jgi:hypothetical protein
MDIIFQKACEPKRWTIVFHRTAANWLFSAIALGHFKHVSAFCWVPEVRVWAIYDVSFNRTRFAFLPDTAESKALLQQVITGNCLVSMEARDDAFPIFRPGLFCTTAIKHLLGLSGGALRPDALYRLCVREGGTVSDDENHRTSSARASSATGTGGRSQPRG